MSYTDIPTAAIDLGILDRITEDEIRLWIAAKMYQTRAGGLAVHCLSIAVNIISTHTPPTYSNWTAHVGDGYCEALATLDETLEQLREKFGSPERRSAEMRRKAERLLMQADELHPVQCGVEGCGLHVTAP